ncbi:MAG: hypothetical protein ACOYLE_01795 [Bacteroidales bacterium]
MRIVLVLIATLIFSNTYSQELSIGGTFGFGTELKTFITRTKTFGGSFEFRPHESIISLNVDPFLIFIPNKVILTTPIYFKFIIGNKLRFCPTIGGFIRTNANYGWKTGLNMEFDIYKSLFLFVTSDYYIDYYKKEIPDHFGTSTSYTDRASSFWFSLGIKKNILK